MPGELGHDAYMSYISDDTNTYNVRTRLAFTAIGGNSPSTRFANPTIPKGYQMRHVYGVQSDGTRKKIPIGTAGDGLFTTGGTFTVSGQSYTVAGMVGEVRRSGA